MRRKETLILLLTVIILALFVDLLGSILFSAFFEDHQSLFITAVVVGLLGVSLFAYLAVLSRAEREILDAQLLFCFSREQKSFIDIPHSPPSVHARVHFSRLSPAIQDDLASYGSPDKFFESDFDHFLNDAIQATLLTLLFSPSLLREEKNMTKVTFQNLPETMKRNACLRRESDQMPDFALSIPEWANLKTYGDYERFIRLTSKYGTLDIDWGLAFVPEAWYTDSYISLVGLNKDDVFEFIVYVSMSYECHFSWMYSRELDEYIKWILEVRRSLEKYDWKKTQELLPLVILGSVAENLRGLKTK